ncbi:ABC transporter permease [Brevibacterium picturae]|uniref:ABC transporter permease subunit n=1 Tax=Brevibacterium picturae TaxID=260553 RepID=A0ABN2C687_9MICO
MSTPTTTDRTAALPRTTRGGCWWGAIAFEWTKLSSVRSTWWIIVAAFVAALLGSWLLGASALASGRNGLDSAMPAPAIVVQTMLVVEIVIVLLSTFTITGEYSTGSITTTLQAVPRRKQMLLAKTAVVLVTGVVLGAALIVVGTPVASASASQFGAFDAVDLVRAIVGTGLGLGLLGVFVLGLATALRSASLTIITVLGLLHLVPNLLPLFGVDAISDLVQYLPNQAMAVLAVDTAGPYGWPTAVLILLGWAMAGLLTGYLVLRSRDV